MRIVARLAAQRRRRGVVEEPPGTKDPSFNGIALLGFAHECRHALATERERKARPTYRNASLGSRLSLDDVTHGIIEHGAAPG